MAIRRALGLLLGALASGCIDPLGQAESHVGKLLRDCVVPLPPGVTGWGAPVSLEYPDHSLWLWDTVTLDDGRTVANVAAEVSSADAACGGKLTLLVTEDGAPRSVLPLTDSELRENEERTDGRQLALLPRGGFVHGGSGYLYYEHRVVGPGVFDSELLGTGLCVFDAGEGSESCRRVEAGGSDVLFPPDVLSLNQGGIVDGDRALIFGCRHTASFTDPCTITGVPVGGAEDPALYLYLGADDRWVREPENARIVMSSPGGLTVSTFRGRSVATLLDIFATRFDLSFAAGPTGEFDLPYPLFRGVAPDSFFPGGGREHVALRPDASTVAVSYSTNHTGAAFGLHLATFRVNEGLE